MKFVSIAARRRIEGLFESRDPLIEVNHFMLQLQLLAKV